MTRKINVVDLFAGSGGLSYGFMEDDLFNLTCAIEILPDMAKSYELNHPGVKVYNEDIAGFGRKKLENDLGTAAGKVDIIIGGPPCQAYSTVGKRLIDDPRASLFQHYYRILKEFQPEFFLFENVKGLVSIDSGELLSHIMQLFSTIGYNVRAKILNAVEYGVPQNRERIIITGSALRTNFNYPTPTHQESEMNISNHSLIPFLSIKDAISDLPMIDSGQKADYYESEPINDYQREMRQNSNGVLMNHDTSNHGKHLIEIMKVLPQGGTLKDIPANIRPKKAFGNSYSRLWWDKPSTTITRNFGTPSSARCIHPLINRALTTREGARLQSFPDHYKFVGSRSSKNLQIGNAVPPLLSSMLANSVKILFKGNH